MSKHSHYLPLAKISEGMVLADDLLDKVGHILLPMGTVLTASMLHSIAHHQVHQLSIEMEISDELDVKKEQESKLHRIHHLFRSQEDKEPASSLKTYLVHYREGQLS
ncbi:hypothetical protein [Undibacterium sp. SXout20W]|uniref:hypothetical protein n=1 Tax=Undibacterium sp. SXout20W TaxID=3413051 RepID=UPI003BEF94B3